MEHPHQVLIDRILRDVDEERLPSELFKYREINTWLERIINSQTLLFRTPLEFNDPFDGQLQFRSSKKLGDISRFLKSIKPPELMVGRAEMRRRARKFANDPNGNALFVKESLENQMRRSGICCFSKEWNSLLQWSYYADGHKGVVLTFSVLEDPLFFVAPIQVVYVDNYPDFDYFKEMHQCLNALITNKAMAWAHEKEVRVYKIPGGEIQFSPTALSEITFGVNCDRQNIEMVKRWCENAGMSHVRLYKAVKKHDSFGLTRKLL